MLTLAACLTSIIDNVFKTCSVEIFENKDPLVHRNWLLVDGSSIKHLEESSYVHIKRLREHLVKVFSAFHVLQWNRDDMTLSVVGHCL